MKPLTFKRFLPGIAWFFVILILICMPSDEIPQPHGWFEWMRLIRIDKIVHCGIFALLSFLFIRPIAISTLTASRKWNYFIKITLAVCIWGLITELIQKFFVPTRQFELVDWAADSIGAFIALLFSRKFYSRQLQKTGN